MTDELLRELINVIAFLSGLFVYRLFRVLINQKTLLAFLVLCNAAYAQDQVIWGSDGQSNGLTFEFAQYDYGSEADHSEAFSWFHGDWYVAARNGAFFNSYGYGEKCAVNRLGETLSTSDVSYYTVHSGGDQLIQFTAPSAGTVLFYGTTYYGFWEDSIVGQTEPWSFDNSAYGYSDVRGNRTVDAGEITTLPYYGASFEDIDGDSEAYLTMIVFIPAASSTNDGVVDPATYDGSLSGYTPPAVGSIHNGGCVVGTYVKYMRWEVTDPYGGAPVCNYEVVSEATAGNVPGGSFNVTGGGSIACPLNGATAAAYYYAIFYSGNPCADCGYNCPACHPNGDDNGDGIPNGDDADGDGIPNGCDADDPCGPGGCDSDGDGEVDDCNSNGDKDGDGIPDGCDATPDNCGGSPPGPCGASGDADGDGYRNDCSGGDADGDGIPDGDDATPYGSGCSGGTVGGCGPGDDFDGDDIRNDAETDPDIDGDGIPNDDDPSPYGCGPGTNCPCGPCEPSGDVDGDGEPNETDDDADDDGVPETADPCPLGCPCCDETDKPDDWNCATCDERYDLLTKDNPFTDIEIGTDEDGLCIPLSRDGEPLEWDDVDWSSFPWSDVAECDWDGDECPNKDDPQPCDEEKVCGDCGFELDEWADKLKDLIVQKFNILEEIGPQHECNLCINLPNTLAGSGSLVYCLVPAVGSPFRPMFDTGVDVIEDVALVFACITVFGWVMRDIREMV